MKLHDNTCFGGVSVVPFSPANFNEGKRLIEMAGGPVGFAYLQENTALKAFKNRLHEAPSRSAPAELRGNRKVQNLTFPGAGFAADGKSHNPICADCDSE